jgi:hypothetical protein
MYLARKGSQHIKVNFTAGLWPFKMIFIFPLKQKKAKNIFKKITIESSTFKDTFKKIIDFKNDCLNRKELTSVKK